MRISKQNYHGESNSINMLINIKRYMELQKRRKKEEELQTEKIIRKKNESYSKLKEKW